MASRADLAAGQRARVKVPGQSTRESALDTIPPVNTSAAVSPMGEERRIRTTAGGGRCPTRTRSLRGSHAGSHTDERLCNFPDFGEHPAESCLRPRTDLNGPECLYGYLRIRRCRPCHIRATHDGDGRSNTVTTGSSLQAPSRTEPLSQKPYWTTPPIFQAGYAGSIPVARSNQKSQVSRRPGTPPVTPRGL